jgi:hypothetical protein
VQGLLARVFLDRRRDEVAHVRLLAAAVRVVVGGGADQTQLAANTIESDSSDSQIRPVKYLKEIARVCDSRRMPKPSVLLTGK